MTLETFIIASVVTGLAAFGAMVLVRNIGIGIENFFTEPPPYSESLDLSGVCHQYGFERAGTTATKNAEGTYDVTVRVIPSYWQLRIINALPKDRPVIVTMCNQTLSLEQVLLGCMCRYNSLDTARIAMSHNKAAIIEFGAFLQNWVPRPSPPAVIKAPPYDPIDEALQ
jgi:hypothetical protein